MSYAEARKLLREASRGIKERPWEVLNASLVVTNARERVPCPKCKVNTIMRFQAQEGQTCSQC